jgi:hypothetical protein
LSLSNSTVLSRACRGGCGECRPYGLKRLCIIEMVTMRRMDDIFSFWSDLSEEEARIHPCDKKVLSRVNNPFEHTCFAEPFRGRLQTAPVVLLFLSPGLHERDLSASTQDREYYSRQREGHCDLPTESEHRTAFDWAKRVTKQFDIDYETARPKVAVLNISPYRSKSFNDWHLLAALPSARITLDWAQNVLFSEAEEGKRIVVCLRSSAYWGLGRTTKSGKSLYAPKCNRAGIMKVLGGDRDEIVSAVKRAVL